MLKFSETINHAFQQTEASSHRNSLNELGVLTKLERFDIFSKKYTGAKPEHYF